MKKIEIKTNTTFDELTYHETIFSQANGFIGIRGTYAEGYGSLKTNQTFMNGVYDYYPYKYEENMTGFPQQGQKLICLPDTQKIKLKLDGKRINLEEATLLESVRTYDLDEGFVKRTSIYQTSNQKTIEVSEKRIVSFKYKELFVTTLSVRLLSGKGKLEVASYLNLDSIKERNDNDPRISNVMNCPEIIRLDSKDALNQMVVKSSLSNIEVMVIMAHDRRMIPTIRQNSIVCNEEVYLEQDEVYTLTKYSIYTTEVSRDLKKYKDIVSHSFASIQTMQKEYLKQFWKTSNITLKNQKELEQILSYNVYQLNSSGAETEYLNIPAKGLSGEGYEGHYFWDSEIYMVPYFSFTNPVKARNVLMYRFHHLEEAKQEAHNLGYQNGVKIPWRTINGKEASPYYPAGTAQFHINSDVAYAAFLYYYITNDLEFMKNYGFTLILETARFLKEAITFYNGEYHLNEVTGPDEYTTCVNDNYYTNSMMKYHFEHMVTFYQEHTDSIKDLTTEEEIEEFSQIAGLIHLPFSNELGIYLQDGSFLQRSDLDLKAIPKNKFPLLLHFHPLYIYKHKVLKQADALLSMMLLNNVNEDVLKKSFEYYEPITTHDSSLSRYVHGVVAFKLGKDNYGLEFLKDVIEADYNNLYQNTSHGLHLANLGGSYLLFLHGLLGLEVNGKNLKLSPKYIEQLGDYEMSFMYQNEMIKVTVEKEQTTVQVTASLVITIFDQTYEIKDSITI